MTAHDDPGSILDPFSPLVRDWFGAAFPAPTPAQVGAWAAIAAGSHTLVVAPTGSGKTLAAFLSAIDSLVTDAPPDRPERRCRVLYVSPLKALAVDVQRNLRSPLAGIAALASARGQDAPTVSVSVRSGDTPSADRRAFARDGTDILITTPESLFLLLTSRAREMLAGVRTVIVDEIHAVAGTKRGTHLAVSLERLDTLLASPAQRIGLSATVRPVEEVARFLAGPRPVTIVAPVTDKVIDLDVVVPVQDMAALGAPTGDLSGPATAGPARASIWPHVEAEVADLIERHRSTIVFANSRRLAERLTARLNEIHAERLDAGGIRADAEALGPPAQVMAQSGATAGAPAVLARAHHGSMSKQQRSEIEDQLKTGRLPAVVATSSLELGIDMGAVDLVVQVEAPPSVASGLQRIGRAGHQVGAASHGIVFPKFRGDLLATAVVADRMRAGAIEALRIPANPLDVAAQQIVAICAMDTVTVEEVHALLRRTAPFAGLGRASLESVLDMLSGRYPSEQFAELRPRITWDRLAGTLTGRPGAQRLAVTSGGTIPDRGLYGVFLAGEDAKTGTPSRRVGELDEEMVYESRVGDVFALGSTSWRIVDITHDRVLVLPAPGVPGRLPFWKGDTPARPAELGRAHGAFVREISSAAGGSAAIDRLRTIGLDEFAIGNLLAYLAEQREATGVVPDEKTIVLERFRDELGDWRIVLHSPYGAAVHAPWALVIAARLRERYGIDASAAHSDDGIVLRLPDAEYPDGPPEIADAIVLDPDTVRAEVTDRIGGSAVFAGRFRECAARALLLPRRQIGRRQPLWQQRQRAAQLLEVASGFPSFPIVAEAVRECLADVFDVPALTTLMRDIAGRTVSIVEVTTSAPSPFARSLLFGYVAQFLYEGDSPLAERRAAALTVDPALLAELVGGGDALALRDLLDPAALAATEAELQRVADGRRARTVDEVADLLRILGPLSPAEIRDRSAVADLDAVVDELAATRRAMPVRISGADRWADPADAGMLRDALGTALPPGIPEAFTVPVADPLGRLLGRHARTRGPFTAAEAAQRYGLGVAVVLHELHRLVGSGRLAEGEFRPLGACGGIEGGAEFVDVEVLRLLRRRSLAALRAEVEPVPAQTLGLFLPAWNGIGVARRGIRGDEALLRAVEQLAGAVLPASALETLILPARVDGYVPAMLDELTSAGEVLWVGHGALAGDDAWLSVHLADTAALTLPPAPDDREQDLDEVARAVLAVLAPGGAYFYPALAEAVSARLGTDAGTDAAAGSGPGPWLGAGRGSGPGARRGSAPGVRLGSAAGSAPGLGEGALTAALWSLVFAGLISSDTLGPIRARLAGGHTAHRSRTAGRARMRGPSRLAMLGSTRPVRRPATPATVSGRWSLVPVAETNPTLRAHATAELLLDRYGILTRGPVSTEEVPGGFAGIYRVLAALEESGRVRRGYFVEGLGAAQFAGSGAVDRLRAVAPSPDDERPLRALVLAAADPANPYGSALDWPPSRADGERHRPARRAGALVVLVDGAAVLYAERGGRSLLSFTADAAVLAAAAEALAARVRKGGIGTLTVGRIDGADTVGGFESTGADGGVAGALLAAGFVPTPRGLRLRAGVR